MSGSVLLFIGAALCVAGLIMIPAPGPGALVVGIGLAVLAGGVARRVLGRDS